MKSGLTRLNRSHIADMRGLTSPINLRELRLAHNLFSDIAPLGNWMNLDVTIANNSILGVALLGSLTNLRLLIVANNQIIVEILVTTPVYKWIKLT